MVKIEALVQPFQLEEIMTTLEGLGIEGITITQVLSHGGPGGDKSFYRGAEYNVNRLRLKLEMIVSSERADETTDAIMLIARRSKSCDGTILRYNVADAVQVRTGARLQYILA